MREAPVTIWIPWHQLRLDCWCQPRVDDGGFVVHRRLPARPDRQARAFVLMRDGVPA